MPNPPESENQRKTDRSQLRDVSPFLFRGFWKYSRRLVRRRFHALRISRDSRPIVNDEVPLLIYGNHASWWDPLVAVIINQELFAPRQFRAPIDAVALERYSILGRLGFFPVEQQTSAGTREFLRTINELFSQSTSVFITPQGGFVDVRRSQPFEPGLAHVVSRLTRGTIVPLAVEYTFWDESTPEILVHFGRPIELSDQPERSKPDWSLLLEAELEKAQAQLAEKGIARDPNAFTPILGGRVGEGGLYDVARRAKALVSRRKFVSGHEFSESPEPGSET